MNQPHVHAAAIKAWADGQTIEMYCHDKTWRSVSEPSWYPEVLYRAKPDPLLEFKEALAAGERVDFRIKGSPPSRGWVELSPEYKDWTHALEYRIALPWQDERDAYDRGEQIQYLGRGPDGFWEDCKHEPFWLEGLGEYRVKPKTTSHECEVISVAVVAPESVAWFCATPFKPPQILLDIESTAGVVTNVTLKEWKA